MPRGELLADKGIPLGQAAEAAAVAILVIGTVSYTLHLVSIESKSAHTPAPNTPTLRKLTLGDFCLRRRRLFFSLLFPDARCLCLRARVRVPTQWRATSTSLNTRRRRTPPRSETTRLPYLA